MEINTGTVAVPNNRKNIIIKNGAPFTNCISKRKNTQIDHPWRNPSWLGEVA